MKDGELEAIEPALGTLFREEQARGQAPAGSKDRVLERLALTIGPSTGGGNGGEPGNGGNGGEGVARPPSTGAGGGTGALGSGHSAASAGAGAVQGLASAALSASRLVPLVGALLTGGLAGGIAGHSLVPPRVVVVERVVGTATATSSSVPAPAAAMDPDIAPTVDALPDAPSSAGVSSDQGRNASRDAGLGREKAILDVARTALGHEDATRALAALQRHASEFPHGQMSEEREALVVQGLIKLDRRREAVERGARFHQSYPRSVLGPVVDAALASVADE